MYQSAQVHICLFPKSHISISDCIAHRCGFQIRHLALIASVKTEGSRKMRDGIVQNNNKHKSYGFDTKCENVKWHTLKYAQADYKPIGNTGLRNYVGEVGTVRTPLLKPFLPTAYLSSAGRLFQA